jgi:Zn-dependent oligopeptidase
LHHRSFDGSLNAWDIAFYKNKVEERDYKVDQQEIKQVRQRISTAINGLSTHSM